MFRDSAGSSARCRVHVCFGPNCTPRGSRALLPRFLNELHAAGLSGEVEVLATTCRGRCEWGPSVNVYPGPVFYAQVSPEAVQQIVREHLAGGRPVHCQLFSTIIASEAKPRRS